jgi:hypothetical protein
MQAGLAAAGGAQPDDVLVAEHVFEGVVEVLDALFVQLGLPIERVRFDDKALWDLGFC